MIPRPSRPSRLVLALVCFAFGLLCLSCLTCAPSKVGKAMNVGLVTSTTADYISTRQIAARGGVELNPILGQSWPQQAAVKSASAAAVIWLTGRLERSGHPRAAHILRGIGIGTYTGAAIHNGRQE